MRILLQEVNVLKSVLNTIRSRGHSTSTPRANPTILCICVVRIYWAEWLFITFIFNLEIKKDVLRENGKKQNAPSERSLKKGLANSGYSEDITDKIWKWYNPPELNNCKLKNNKSI